MQPESLKKTLAVTPKNSRWTDLLAEFFEDTGSGVVFMKPEDAACKLGNFQPDILFLESPYFGASLVQKLKAYRQTHPAARFFALGPVLENFQIEWDDIFFEPEGILSFQKQIVLKLPLPEMIKVLVVDDEPEIGNMLREFLDGRTQPSFKVDYAENGVKALERLSVSGKYDIAILDVKMPVMDGRELYRKIREQKMPIPAIVFFDAITGDELLELRKWGRPCVVEKGARHSAMPEMMALIKKMVYFGAPA